MSNTQNYAGETNPASLVNIGAIATSQSAPVRSSAAQAWKDKEQQWDALNERANAEWAGLCTLLAEFINSPVSNESAQALLEVRSNWLCQPRKGLTSAQRKRIGRNVLEICHFLTNLEQKMLSLAESQSQLNDYKAQAGWVSE